MRDYLQAEGYPGLFLLIYFASGVNMALPSALCDTLVRHIYSARPDFKTF